jgi:hypothetical protein
MIPLWISITIISWDYLYLSLANEYVGDVTIPTQVIKHDHIFLQPDQPIGLQYSHQIKWLKLKVLFFIGHNVFDVTPTDNFHYYGQSVDTETIPRRDQRENVQINDNR